ncbi:MAG TPA: alcohol dehydrogenase catalytic domain-containing protein, partial [Planctomycetaceae bacterium]|nr:alcohol dehydrogenase catalytic domain-containing protein [Planctomycetaceae bacterium]
MLAVVQESFAEPAQSVAVRDRASGELHAGQVLVEMLASPVNPSDLMTLRGSYGRRPDLPAVPGYEGVGIVRKAAAGLYGRWLVGQRVAVICPTGGAWAEQLHASARQVIPLPRTLSVEQGAMFFVNPATAWLMTRSVLAIPRGAWLLQTAAASAVGRMIIRLGRETGFRTLNVVRREDQAEQLRRDDLPEDSRVIVFDSAIDARDTLRD